MVELEERLERAIPSEESEGPEEEVDDSRR